MSDSTLLCNDSKDNFVVQAETTNSLILNSFAHERLRLIKARKMLKIIIMYRYAARVTTC